MHGSAKNSTIDGRYHGLADHADMQQAIIPPAATNALLPLFLDNANSVAMIRHSMDVIKAAIQHLNPGESMEVNEARKRKNQELWTTFLQPQAALKQHIKHT